MKISFIDNIMAKRSDTSGEIYFRGSKGSLSVIIFFFLLVILVGAYLFRLIYNDTVPRLLPQYKRELTYSEAVAIMTLIVMVFQLL